MQFRLHPPHRVVRRTFVRPLHGAGIHRRVFGHCRPSLLDTLPSFPMCTGFPWLGVLRRLRPIHTLRQASRLSVASHRAGRTTAERSRMVPTSTGIRSTGEAPDCAPAPSPRLRRRPFTVASQPRLSRPDQEFPARHEGQVRTATQPASTGLELVKFQEAYQRRFLAYTFPSRSPGPAHPAVLNRPDFVEAAFHPPRRTAQAASRFTPPLRRQADDGLSPHPKHQRLVAQTDQLHKGSASTMSVTYTAVLPVRDETVDFLAGLLAAERARRGTRADTRALSVHDQAVLVLRWFLDGIRMSQLARDNAIGKSTGYDYLHEGIDVLAARAPSLHGALLAAKAAGYSHVSIDGVLIETDRVSTPGPTPGVDLWWSGNCATRRCHFGWR